VTPAGKPFDARAAAPPMDGDAAVEGALWHAALMTTAEAVRMMRLRELFIRICRRGKWISSSGRI